MAEAWNRSRRKVAVFFIAGVLTFSGGCGFAGNANNNPENPTPTSTSQGVEGHPEFGSTSLPQPAVSEEVATRFGEKDALVAYNMGAQFILDHQMDGNMISTDVADVDPSDLASTRKMLTPDRQKDWDARFAAATTDKDAWAAIAGLDGVGLARGDIAITDPITSKQFTGTFRTDVSPSFNRKISSPQLTIAPDGRLKATFASNCTFRVKANNANYLVPISNKTTLWFKKAGNTWKIDGWYASWPKHDADTAVRDKS